MKGKKKNRCLSLVIAGFMFVTTFGLIGASAQDVSAESTVTPIDKKVTPVYYPKAPSSDYNLFWIADDKEWTISMKSVKSSNKKVAVLKHKYGTYWVKVKKAGKATLIFKAKAVGSSKYVKKTVKVTATKYEAVIKSLKIGSKDYSKKFKKVGDYYRAAPFKGKLNIKLKKGWKVDAIYFYDDSTEKTKKIKNKAKVRLDAGDSLSFVFKKGKKYSYSYLGVYSNGSN